MYVFFRSTYTGTDITCDTSNFWKNYYTIQWVWHQYDTPNEASMLPSVFLTTSGEGEKRWMVISISAIRALTERTKMDSVFLNRDTKSGENKI